MALFNLSRSARALLSRMILSRANARVCWLQNPHVRLSRLAKNARKRRLSYVRMAQETVQGGLNRIDSGLLARSVGPLFHDVQPLVLRCQLMPAIEVLHTPFHWHP